jgi:SAM-dependent methyltransferase
MSEVDPVAANHLRWEERVAIHRADATGFYRIAQFLAGDTTLHAIEDADLPDLTGLRICHLQCHFGLDTLKLLRRGAASVVGVDYSGKALAAAAELTDRIGAEARWVESDVRRAHEALQGERFDFVYTTWGTVAWFPHVDQWGEAVSALVTPGGRFYMADAHPQMRGFEWEDGRFEHRYGWRTPTDEPDEDESDVTYTGDTTPMKNRRSFDWSHPLSDIFGGLLEGGLLLRRFTEHEGVPWQMFPCTVRGEDGLWRLPPDLPKAPLAFSMLWERPK